VADQGLALLTVVLAWWFSTGAILYLGGLHRRTFPWSMILATVALAAAIIALFTSAKAVTTANVYIAFLSALAVWGWIEMSFLFGLITGPRTTPCPPDARGWRRFKLASETVIYHEIMIACAAVSIIALTWDAPNQTGTLAFLTLAAMRLSAKLNIFLGVPNLAHEMLPKRLDYLKSYFRKRRFNAFFPVSVIASLAAAFAIGDAAFGDAAEGAASTGAMLVFTILALGLLEHFFMILPVQDSALWRWAMPSATAPSVKRRDPSLS
jgi:putative photosynthetic complex assembly protein 2